MGGDLWGPIWRRPAGGGGPCSQVVLRGFQVSDVLILASISTVTGGGTRLVDKGRVVRIWILGETVSYMA